MPAAPPTTRRQLIAVEGYMDAIALAEAGFPQTVAPLGTALTEDQIQLLWRMAPEPVLCFDGDAAGRRAAFRAVETVLPHLQARLQRAVRLPARRPRPRRPHPPARRRRVPGRARHASCCPLRRADGARGARATRRSRPEQRASLEARLKALVGPHRRLPMCAGSTRRELKATLWEKNRKTTRDLAGFDGRRDAPLCRQAAQQHRTRLASRGARREPSAPAGRPRARQPGLAGGAQQRAGRAHRHRCPPARRCSSCTLLNHPWLLEARCEEVAELVLTSPPLIRLRDALLELLAQEHRP